MSRRNSAPTHGWVIGSQVNRWLALIFVIIILFLFISAWAIKYSLDRDCTQLYKRQQHILGYWINIQAGSSQPGCPQ